MSDSLSIQRKSSIFPIVKRLVWKELNLLIPLFLTLALLGLIIILLAAQFDMSEFKRSMILIAAGFSFVFAVATGAVTFATEKEVRTFGYLQSLPIPPRIGGWVKLFLGLLLTILFAALLGGAVYLRLEGWMRTMLWSEGNLPWLAFSGFLLPVVETYLCTVICSLLVRKTMTAAVLGVSLIALFYFLLSLLFQLSLLTSDRFDWWFEVVAGNWLIRLFFLGVLLVTCVSLTSRWLSVSFERQQQSVASRFSFGLPNWPFWQRCQMLAWQTTRQSLRSLPLASLVMILFPLLSAFLLIWSLNSPYSEREWENPIPDWFRMTILLSVSVCACQTFSVDQTRKQKLFFVQQAEYPRLLWLVRNTIWIAALCGLALMFLILMVVLDLTIGRGAIAAMAFNLDSVFEGLLNVRSDHAFSVIPTELVRYLLGFVAAFAIGQWFSMVVRQPVIRLVLALLAALLFFYLEQPLNGLQLPAWWSVLPFILALLVGTWWYAPAWLADQKQIAHWLKPLVPIAVATGIILLMIPQARINQIPKPSDFAINSVSDLIGSPALENARNYHRALEAYSTGETSNESEEWDWELPVRDWKRDRLEKLVVASEKTYALLEQGVQADHCYPFLEDTFGSRKKHLELKKIYWTYVARAELALRNGDLAESFRLIQNGLRSYWQVTSFEDGETLDLYRFLGHWANHPKQSKESVDQAWQWLRANSLQGVVGYRKRGDAVDWYAHFWLFDQVRQGKIDVPWKPYPFYEPSIKNWNAWFPWERERERRLAANLARYASNYYFESRDVVSVPSLPGKERDRAETTWFYSKSSLSSLDFYKSIARSHGYQKHWNENYFRGRQGLISSSHDRMVRLLMLKLLLIEFRMDQGHYPDDYQQLSQFFKKQREKSMLIQSTNFPLRVVPTGKDREIRTLVRLEDTDVDLLSRNDRQKRRPEYLGIQKIIDKNQPFFMDYLFELSDFDEFYLMEFYGSRGYVHALSEDSTLFQLGLVQYPEIYYLPKIKPGLESEE